MSNTITAVEKALIASLKTLPELPTVVAPSVLVAQSVKLNAEERAAITARQAVFGKLGLPTAVTLVVQDHRGVRIGDLVFTG
jgi:hypothetical protein